MPPVRMNSSDSVLCDVDCSEHNLLASDIALVPFHTPSSALCRSADSVEFVGAAGITGTVAAGAVGTGSAGNGAGAVVSAGGGIRGSSARAAPMETKSAKMAAPTIRMDDPRAWNDAPDLSGPARA